MTDVAAPALTAAQLDGLVEWGLAVARRLYPDLRSNPAARISGGTTQGAPARAEGCQAVSQGNRSSGASRIVALSTCWQNSTNGVSLSSKSRKEAMKEQGR